MNNGFNATEGSMSDNTYVANTSFDSFLAAMDEEQEHNGTVEEFKDYSKDKLGKGFEEDFGEGGNTFEEMFGADEDEVSFEDELEESKTDESDENENDDTTESGDYEVQDWEGTFKLPDGTEVNGLDLKAFKSFEDSRKSFQEEKQRYHQREQLVVQDTNIGFSALAMMENQLSQVAQQRPLTVVEQAQLQNINFMKNQFQGFSDKLKSTYVQDIEQQKVRQEKLMEQNINVLFDEFEHKGMNLVQELGTVKNYLQSKGLSQAEANNLMKMVNYDSKLIGVLMDASAGERAKAKVKVQGPSKATKTPVITRKEPSKEKQVSLPDGISSYDRESYKAFAEIFDFN